MDEQQLNESLTTALSAIISYGPVTQVEMYPIRARFESITQAVRRTEERVVEFQVLVPYSSRNSTKPKMTASQDTVHTNRRKGKKNGSKIRRKTQPLAIKQNGGKTKKSNVTRVCCRICWDTATELKKQGIYMHVTRCGHVLCALCLIKILQFRRTCPCCRTEITYPVRPLYLE